VLVVPISRVEIADHVRDVFEHGPVTRTELLAGAADHGARPAVLHTLQRLPDRVYHEVRELWPDIPDVPIETDHWMDTAGS
jgi:hypothetical protein